MRTPSQHILFIATEYAAGMRPYADTIIHSLWQQGDHVLIVAKDDTVKHDFDDLPADSVTWVDYPASKLKKLAFRFRPSQLIRKIEELVKNNYKVWFELPTGALTSKENLDKESKLYGITIYYDFECDSFYVLNYLEVED